MAKKKQSNKSLPSQVKKKRGRPKGTTKKTVNSKSKPKSTPKKKYQRKRGRKPSAPNKYNEIKKAISEYYQSSVGRRVKRYELKVIYSWIKTTYGNQSLKYILMNIDVILDNFWSEYCNLYPVNIENFARFFDWYYFKNYLFDEVEYHYPSDIIQVDLSQIGQGTFEFFMDEYAEKSEELYVIGKSAGLKDLEKQYPMIYLKSAYCDVSRKGNVFEYVLLLDGEIPDETAPIEVKTPIVTLPKAEVERETKAEVEKSPISEIKAEKSSEDANVEIQKAIAEQEKAKAEQEKAKAESQKAIAEQEKAKTIQKALDMLIDGKISQEQFDMILRKLG
jgi:hypothetical protein